MPDEAETGMTPAEAVKRIRELRAELAARGVRVTHEEIIEWKNAGRDTAMRRLIEKWDREDADRAAGESD